MSGKGPAKPETKTNQLEEWKQCIAWLDSFEDRLDAVRKYGFTFISGLLSADTLLGQVNGTVIPVSVKLAVLWIAAFLILIMRVLDRDYQLYQSAIGGRARELEKSLGMGLEHSIIAEYVGLKMWRLTLGLYYGFEAIILLLGIAVVWGDVQLMALAVIGPLVAMALIRLVEPVVQKSKKSKKQPSEIN